MQSKNSKNKGLTLIELLLAIAMFAILFFVCMPYFGEAYVSVNDGTAEQMVINLISSTKSMAVAGRVNESTITFKADGTINIGNSTYKLPSNFSFDISDNKSFTFNLNGSVTPSNQSITIKRKGYSRSIAVK